jgi:S-adenosylmethionine-diacylglycerol 3-amino-3-carboxypropyl transferase
MGKYGRDPEFLKEVNVTVSNYIYMKAERQLKKPMAQENHILYFNLNGNFGSHLPHYLKEENYSSIQKNIGKLILLEGYTHDAISHYGKFDGMNLSNIFEYMDKELFKGTAQNLVEGSDKGSRLCYWNLMVPRRISGVLDSKVQYEKETSSMLSEKDKGFFYNQFIAETVL